LLFVHVFRLCVVVRARAGAAPSGTPARRGKAAKEAPAVGGGSADKTKRACRIALWRLGAGSSALTDIAFFACARSRRRQLAAGAAAARTPRRWTRSATGTCKTVRRACTRARPCARTARLAVRSFRSALISLPIFAFAFAPPATRRARPGACRSDEDDSDEPYDEEAASYRLYGRSPGAPSSFSSSSQPRQRVPAHRCVVVLPPRAASDLEEQQLALALALSLSLSSSEDSATHADADAGDAAAVGGDAHAAHARRHAAAAAAVLRVGASSDALSFETLVELEDVRPVAPAAEIDALPTPAFCADAHGGADTRCAICLEVYVAGEALLALPCAHLLHAGCGRTWLAGWSKRCPEVACRRSILPWDTHD
jgi:hypothetical protein